MAVTSALSSRPTTAALQALTAVTGLVDAVSHLPLGQVFVANMTGNVVFLGFSADPRTGLSAVASMIAIAGFTLGALAGGRITDGSAAEEIQEPNGLKWLFKGAKKNWSIADAKSLVFET